MKKAITLGLCCLVFCVQAQVFNRSLPTKAPYDSPVITHYNGALVYANASVVQEFDASGTVVRSIQVPDSVPQASIFHTGMFHHPNGNLMLYGYFHEGCDVFVDQGFYIYELNSSFSWVRTKVQSMPMGGVLDLIAMDNNRLFMLSGDGYAILNGTSLDTISSAKFTFSWDVRQALYLGGDEVLIESRTWASAQPVQLRLDVSTQTVSFTGLSGGYHFDVSDTLIGVFKPANYRVVLYNRFTQIATDSVDLNVSGTPFFADVASTRNHLILKSNQSLHGYAFPNMDSVGTYTAYGATGLFAGSAGQMSSTQNGTVALIGPSTSHVPMESGLFGAPHAPVFGPLSMKVRNTDAKVTSIDTNGFHSTGTRGVWVEADWEIMLYNNSNEALDSFRLMHTLPPNYFCGPRYAVTADTVYTLQARDSMKLYANEISRGPIRITGTAVTSFFEVHAVMGNGKQVDAASAVGAVVIPNVGEEEYAEIQFEMYPNPAQERLRITSPEAWRSVKLLSLEGKTVRYYHPADETGEGLHLSGLAPGVYVVQVLFEGGRVNKKLLVQ